MSKELKMLITGILIFLFGGIIFFLHPALKDIMESTTEEVELKNEHADLPQTIKIPQKTAPLEKKVQGSFYVNFTCPHCRTFYKTSLASLKKEYAEDLSITVYNYPFLETGLEMEMAKFFLCAKEQKEAFFVLDYFFFGLDEITQMQGDLWSEELKLDTEKMDICLNTAAEKVVAEKNAGKEKGVRGAPTLFIEKEEISEKFEGNIEKYQIEMKILPLVK